MEIKTKVTKIADSFQRTDKYGLSVEHLITDSPEKTFLVTKVGNRFNVSVAMIIEPVEEPEKKDIEDDTETRKPVGRVQSTRREKSSGKGRSRKRG